MNQSPTLHPPSREGRSDFGGVHSSGDGAQSSAENPIVLLQQMHRWRMAFFGLVILLAGIVIGGSSALLIFRPRLPAPPMGPEVMAGQTLADLQRHLRLTPEQNAAIGRIMRTYMDRFREIRMRSKPEIMALLQQMRDDTAAVLTEEQRRLWEQRIHRYQDEFWPPGGGPRGPGGPDGLDRPGFRGGREQLGPRGPGGQFRGGLGPAGPNRPAP